MCGRGLAFQESVRIYEDRRWRCQDVEHPRVRPGAESSHDGAPALLPERAARLSLSGSFFVGSIAARAAAHVLTASLSLGDARRLTKTRHRTFMALPNPRSRCVVLWAACAKPVLHLSTIYGVDPFCDAGRVFLKYVANAAA